MGQSVSARTAVEHFVHNSAKVGDAFETAIEMVLSVPPRVAPHLESYEDDAKKLRGQIATARLALDAIRSDVEQHRRSTPDASAHVTELAFAEEVLQSYDEAYTQGREPSCDDGGFRLFRATLGLVRMKFPSFWQMRHSVIDERMTVLRRLETTETAKDSRRDGRTKTKEERNRQVAKVYHEEIGNDWVGTESVTSVARRLVEAATRRGVDLGFEMAKDFIRYLADGWDGSDANRPDRLTSQIRRKGSLAKRKRSGN